jgi:hypothetical protein
MEGPPCRLPPSRHPKQFRMRLAVIGGGKVGNQAGYTPTLTRAAGLRCLHWVKSLEGNRDTSTPSIP